ncbi:putative bifunctional diguanylate cyclase/phosphodiesterase [Modestobacter marinus]|uniref:putative bifunctional diguanylate cyclase/phosphodiesterase n=1 Tax=Modestobacter marinus TaxID=477641 RepID=UPI001C961D4C|nr:EAL domain-containing protein [Modestobacter marinus]
MNPDAAPADAYAMAGAPPRAPLPGSFYEALFAHALDGVLVGSPDGRVLRANARACELLGRSEDELVRIGRNGIADPSDPQWAAAVATRARTGAFRGLLRMQRGDGSTFPAEVTSAAYLEDGSPRAYVSFRDLSAEEAEAVRTVENRRAAAEVVDSLEAISDMYVGVDADWTITYINGQAERRLGVTRQQVLGGDLWQTFPALIGSPFEEAHRRAVDTRCPATVEAHYAPADLWCEVRAYPLRRGGLGIYFRDVARRRAGEQERERLFAAERAARAEAEQAQYDLVHQATHDELTGLLNRTGLLQQADRLLAARPGGRLTVMFIDLDRFKLVNDSFGHGTGDRLLAVFAHRLGDLADPAHLVARFGGDEFVVAMVDVSAAEAGALAEQVIAASREAVEVGPQLLVTASIGLATALDGEDLDSLLRDADAALYRAKDAGREQIAWFDRDMHEQSVRRVETERDLRDALLRHELLVDYQPAYDLCSGRVTHVEALVRWRHPVRGLLPPQDFIPVAEECGLIHRVGEWVLARAIEQAACWADVPGLRVWVNVSPQQLAVAGLAELLAGRLARAGLPAERLGIEVTESTLADATRLIQTLQEVRAMGVAVAIDDFGTGYSSLARLTACPVDVIKIDRSFVADLGTPRGGAVLSGIVTLAHAIGAHVIAEGVEAPEQLSALRALGVDSASGFLLARPAPPAQVPLALTPVGAGG